MATQYTKPMENMSIERRAHIQMFTRWTSETNLTDLTPATAPNITDEMVANTADEDVV